MKFTVEGDESDFEKLVDAKAELKMARMLLTGNPHQQIDVHQLMNSALQLRATQQQQTLPYYQQPQHALPAAQPQPTSQQMHVPQYAPPTIIDTPFQFQLPADTPPPKRIKQVRFGRKAKKAAIFAGTIIVLGGGIVVFDLLNQAGFMSPNLMPSAIKQDEILEGEQPENISEDPQVAAEPPPTEEAAANEGLLPVPSGEPPPLGCTVLVPGSTVQEQLNALLDSPAVCYEDEF